MLVFLNLCSYFLIQSEVDAACTALYDGPNIGAKILSDPTRWSGGRDCMANAIQGRNKVRSADLKQTPLI